MLYRAMRPFLFGLDPELAHQLSLNSLGALHRLGLSGMMACSARPLPVQAMGMVFPNPVGLAPGLDKNGEYIDALASLGFGFLEIGAVTPRPQPGNPQPRLFRIPEAGAIINRMGFNNLGVDHLCARVSEADYKGVLGINIGKNKDTPLERAAEDYLLCLERVHELASYITINLSSPNTPGLRDLQYGATLERLLDVLKTEQARLAAEHGRYVPLAIKIAPDIADADLPTVGQALIRYELDAVIATNTTFSRVCAEGLPHAGEAGGLSGAPLLARSTAVVKQLHEILGGKLPIIAVGGILNGADATAKIAAGASLVQLYTGFIYRGPELIREAVEALR